MGSEGPSVGSDGPSVGSRGPSVGSHGQLVGSDEHPEQVSNLLQILQFFRFSCSGADVLFHGIIYPNIKVYWFSERRSPKICNRI